MNVLSCLFRRLEDVNGIVSALSGLSIDEVGERSVLTTLTVSWQGADGAACTSDYKVLIGFDPESVKLLTAEVCLVVLGVFPYCAHAQFR